MPSQTTLSSTAIRRSLGGDQYSVMMNFVNHYALPVILSLSAAANGAVLTPMKAL